MTKVSYYNSASDTCSVNQADVYAILECIRVGGKDGRIRSIVEAFRADPIANKMMKKSLPVIMWQGVFTYRSNATIEALSGLMCIDVDHITDAELTAYKEALSKEPWVMAMFRSPSGEGMKVVVMTDNYDISLYKNIYCQIEDMFEKKYGIRTDVNCEPISQGCFASYDPDIYVNLNVEALHFEHDPAFDKVEKSHTQSKSTYIAPPPPSPAQIFMSKLGPTMTDEQLVEILDKKFSRHETYYKDGYRTRSIFVQASMMCKAGIDLSLALEYLKSRFLPTGYNEDKLAYEVKRGYEKCANQFGMERRNYKP